MPPLSGPAFADAVAALDRDALARFVAALERARGGAATVEGDVVVVRPGAGGRDGHGPDERRLWIHAPGRLNRSTPRPPPEADAVVTPLRDPAFGLGVPVVDADDLRDLALYGVPTAERDRLFAAHLGRDPTAAGDGRPGPGRVFAGVVAAVLVVVAAVAVGMGAVGSGPSTAPDEADAPVATTTDDGRYPPGLSDDGVTDARRLGQAHRAALEGQSYVLTSNRTVRYANGTLRSRLDVRVRLGADREYLAEAATAGPEAPVFLGRPPARGVYWSNGTVYARRLTRDGGRVYNTFDPRSGAATWRYWTTTVPFGGDRPEAVYEDVLGSVPVRVTSTRERAGTRRYFLFDDGPPADGFGVGSDVAGVNVRAVVADPGVVRLLVVRYEATVGGERVRVTWRIRYDGVGRTTVERPAWLDRAIRGDQESV